MTDTISERFLPSPSEIKAHLGEIKNHLANELVPFWMTHGVDQEYGGYLTYFDRDGKPTGESLKTLLCQARMIYAFSYAHRCGYGGGYFLEKSKQGVDFVIRHFWDFQDEGWFWTAERDGTPADRKKIVYGHSFVIYAFAEYAKASCEGRAVEWAIRTFDLLLRKAADLQNGGFYEFFEQDWRHTAPGVWGGDSKSMDVHMHLMEAFTNLYLATGDTAHSRAAGDMADLIVNKMTHRASGTGIAQFAPDFTPRRAIIFKNVWGSDRDAEDSEGRPLDNTSYGHNVEFGWLLNWSIKARGIDGSKYRDQIRRMYEHCLEFGIDWQRGGVFCEGPENGPARERNKEFWQQAETLVAMLDGLQEFGESRYWEAYTNVHRFVMDHVINHDVGEWFALLSRDNKVLWDYLGHAWKINYHTLRTTLECERRLTGLSQVAGEQV